MRDTVIRNWWASIAILVFFVVGVICVHSIGVSSRNTGRPVAFGKPGMTVVLFKTTPEVYSYWKDSGFKGMKVMHMGRFLHFIEPDITSRYAGIKDFPVKAESLLGAYEAQMGESSYLWLALRGGIARELIHIVPDEVFREKVQAVEGIEGLSVAEDGIITNFFGSRRTVSGTVKGQGEPVLLNLDASYLLNIEPEEAYQSLKDSGLSLDMITLTLSVDNPQVGKLERERLLRFRELTDKGMAQ